MSDIEEFEKTMNEEPSRADETKIIIDTPDRPTEGKPDLQAALEPPQAVNMSVGQFGATVAGIYCTVSDFVYKRIKKTAAPEWNEADREALTGALVPVLDQYNITVSPITNLIVTLAMIEAMRYSRPSTRADESGND